MTAIHILIFTTYIPKIDTNTNDHYTSPRAPMGYGHVLSGDVRVC